MRRGSLTLVVIGTVAIATAVASASPTVRAAERNHGCGHERWPVKTLTDAAGMSLDLTKPSVKTTVEELRRLKVPATWKKTAPRIAPIETTLYRVTALLMSMKREKDADIHAVDL